MRRVPKVCEEKRDRYGRTLAEVWTKDNKSVAEELLKNGLAKVYIPSSCGEELRESYEGLKLDAMLAGVGIWSVEDSTSEEIPPVEEVSIPAPAAGTYECGTKTYCTQMESCEEAQYFLNTCGLDALDRDDDGIPCESLCGGS